MKNAKEIARDVMPFHVPNEFLPLIEKAVIAGLEAAAKVCEQRRKDAEKEHQTAMQFQVSTNSDIAKKHEAESCRDAIRKLKGE